MNPIDKHQVDQWQCTTHHMRYCCSSSSSQVCTKLLRSHRYKDCPKTCTKSKCSTSRIHCCIIFYIAAEKINTGNDRKKVKQVQSFFPAFEILTDKSNKDIANSYCSICIHNSPA